VLENIDDSDADLVTAPRSGSEMLGSPAEVDILPLDDLLAP
jgi:hypothetical protein